MDKIFPFFLGFCFIGLSFSLGAAFQEYLILGKIEDNQSAIHYCILQQRSQCIQRSIRVEGSNCTCLTGSEKITWERE